MFAADGLPEAYDVVRNALHAIGPQADIAQIGVFETYWVFSVIFRRAPNSHCSALIRAFMISGEVFC